MSNVFSPSCWLARPGCTWLLLPIGGRSSKAITFMMCVSASKLDTPCCDSWDGINNYYRCYPLVGGLLKPSRLMMCVSASKLDTPCCDSCDGINNYYLLKLVTLVYEGWMTLFLIWSSLLTCRNGFCPRRVCAAVSFTAGWPRKKVSLSPWSLVRFFVPISFLSRSDFVPISFLFRSYLVPIIALFTSTDVL